MSVCREQQSALHLSVVGLRSGIIKSKMLPRKKQRILLCFKAIGSGGWVRSRKNNIYA